MKRLEVGKFATALPEPDPDIDFISALDRSASRGSEFYSRLEKKAARFLMSASERLLATGFISCGL